MPRQAKNTLLSLSSTYQQGVNDNDYEVIVVENSSEQALDKQSIQQLPANFRYIYRQETQPSPVFAIHEGVALSKGQFVGVIIDGARMATPGMVKSILQASYTSDNAIIAVPGYHLGQTVQQEAMNSGYNEEVESQLLESINWPKNGYRLFEIGCFSASTRPGFFLPISESNCLSMPRHIWDKTGGIDLGFNTHGGGMANLDFYKRVVELPETELILIPGEGTFHQFHGGVTTGQKKPIRDQVMIDIHQQYERLRGSPYQPPQKKASLFGLIRPEVIPFMDHSINMAKQQGARNDQKENVQKISPSKAQQPKKIAHTYNSPKISVLVIGYRMSVQLANTLYSLSTDYQRNIAPEDYEVVVIENESDDNLDEHFIKTLSGNFRYFRRQETAKSPVHAINFGFQQCHGEFIGLMIDGARMLTPRVLEFVKMAREFTPQAIVAIPGYHLGNQEQHLQDESYSVEQNQQLLKNTNWKNDGYRLFNISTFSNSNRRGYLQPMFECNCVFASKENFAKIGYADERFDLPGGGSINLHMYRCLGLIPGTQLFVLPGEGSFHQFHGGVTTSNYKDLQKALDTYSAQLDALWPEEGFQALRREPVLLGSIHRFAHRHLEQSSQTTHRRYQILDKLEKPYWPDDDLVNSSQNPLGTIKPGTD
jgi:glycosyltransferase involved in cell wall biosynthesis